MTDPEVSGLVFWLGVGFIVGCVSVALTGCGDPGPVGPPVCDYDPSASVSYIIGGEPSEDRRSTVQVKNPRGGFCTGTIVGPRTVLTAAHCEDLARIYVEENGLTTYGVEGDLEHPLYDFPNHDLRLLRTGRDLPPPYATLGSFPKCTSLLAQGYGFEHFALYETAVEDLGRSRGIIYAGPGICNGDSGGPLWATDGETYQQVGVSSFGIGAPNECNGNTGFVDLEEPANLQWVLENIE